MFFLNLSLTFKDLWISAVPDTFFGFILCWCWSFYAEYGIWLMLCTVDSIHAYAYDRILATFLFSNNVKYIVYHQIRTCIFMLFLYCVYFSAILIVTLFKYLWLISYFMYIFITISFIIFVHFNLPAYLNFIMFS